MSLSVTFDRTALSLPDLVIDSDPFSDGFHIPEDGVTRPDFDYRIEYAPDSTTVPGRFPLSAVLGDGVLDLSIYVHGDDADDLEANRQVLIAAAGQWAYDVTLTVDGVAQTFEAWPAYPRFVPLDSGMAAANLDRCALVVPVNMAGA